MLGKPNLLYFYRKFSVRLSIENVYTNATTYNYSRIIWTCIHSEAFFWWIIVFDFSSVV